MPLTQFVPFVNVLEQNVEEKSYVMSRILGLSFGLQRVGWGL